VTNIKAGKIEAGVHSGETQVAPVSHFWLARLVEIDATWNPKSWSERLFVQELSNPAAREAFRKTTYVSLAATGIVSGFGGASYELAIEAAAGLVGAARS
jgi:hypothetical protein